MPGCKHIGSGTLYFPGMSENIVLVFHQYNDGLSNPIAQQLSSATVSSLLFEFFDSVI